MSGLKCPRMLKITFQKSFKFFWGILPPDPWEGGIAKQHFLHAMQHLLSSDQTYIAFPNDNPEVQ